MTKPSEWTPQEAWIESARTHYFGWRGLDWAKDWGAFHTLPFPPDPVERVSDETVSVLADGRPVVMQRNAIQLMAIELIERRAKDKQVERSDPTIVYDEEELTPGPKERKS